LHVHINVKREYASIFHAASDTSDVAGVLPVGWVSRFGHVIGKV
jgi:hypothetical protein